MSNYEWTCEHCTETFHDLYDAMRSRVGRFEVEVDGSTEQYERLCEDCYRDLIRG